MSYYQTIFTLVQLHKYSIADLENLIPYEWDLYIEMLASHLEATKVE